jgi:thymidylate synthase (FAD)
MPSVEFSSTGLPYISAPAHQTAAGTPYVREPGVHLVARSQTDLSSAQAFLGSFDETLHFDEYLDDPTSLPDGSRVCKFAGQLCYMSFGPKRTWNENAERYFNNIKVSGHGSVLEHATFSFLLYGISRSVTHELVRHRAGFAYSQVSQRYVSGRVLRFVERPEYVDDPELHAKFERRIDQAAEDYHSISEGLLARQKEGSQILSGEAKTDLRKKVQQTARSVLPNETEAPIIVTGNARAWRHVIEMRANDHAETEIREMAFRVYLCLKATDPILFGDYDVADYPDGTQGVTTTHRKV